MGYRRLAGWLRTWRAQRELAEEIETHRLMTERQLREAGMSAADAGARSRRMLGNAVLAREDARAASIAPWIDGLLQDVRYAARIIGRAPGFAVAMVAVMALGIGATTGVFGI